MPGNKEGGKKTAKTNYKRYGKDFYARIGAMGGSAKTNVPKGFAAMDPEKRKEAGRKGGQRSRRTKWDN